MPIMKSAMNVYKDRYLMYSVIISEYILFVIGPAESCVYLAPQPLDVIKASYVHSYWYRFAMFPNSVRVIGISNKHTN